MTVWKSVGHSRYKGDTNGVEQFLQEHAASRILDLIEIVARQPGCRRMTVNEGRRTRPRQRTLRARYEAHLRGGPWAPLAAALYLSRHDEETHGNAADLGGPDGEALNAAERAAISRFGPAIGVHFTGLSFGEPWHVEADETPYTRRYAGTDTASGSATQIPEEDEMSAAGEATIIRLLEVLVSKSDAITNNITDPRVGITATNAKSADKLDAIERHTLALANAVTDPKTGVQATSAQVAAQTRK